MVDLDSFHSGDICLSSLGKFLFICCHEVFSIIAVLTGIIFAVLLFVQLIINLISVFGIFNKVFFSHTVKLCGFKFEHFSIHFSSDFIFLRQYTNFQKRLKFYMYFYGISLCKILEILQFLQYTKICETMENVGIALFYRICLLAALISMRFLILTILHGDESKAVNKKVNFLCKAVFSVYYSVYLQFLLSKKILLCSLLFIKCLVLCTLR